MREQILAEIEKIRRKYKESAEEIVSGYNREFSLSKDYEGRQMFELLQNADDESECSSGKVLIDFDGKVLTVSNTGTPFSFRGIKSLLYPNASPKKIHANKIGSKGLGFRSVLTWANAVTVASDGFTIQFSKDYAADFLKSIINENPTLSDEIKALSLDVNPIATLTCPRILEQSALVDGYSTSIIIDCKEEMIDKIEAQIRSLEFEELVFLSNLKEIEIQSTDYHKVFYKVVDKEEVIIESKDLLTGEEYCASWHLYKNSGTIVDDNNEPKSYEFIIAYDPTGEHTGEVLYSYFKTDVKLNYPALIHGTFELTSDRNSLQKGSLVNTQLVDILADFLVQTAVYISESQEKCNYDPLRMIIASDMDYVLTNTYHLDKLLKNKARELRILPTISGNYISLSDVPLYSDHPFDKVLDPVKFWDLMPITEDDEIRNYIKDDLDIHFYSYKYFCNTLNESISIYPIQKKVELIRLIELQYGSINNDEVFPHLLEDSNAKIIDTPVRVYPLPNEEQVIDLPAWVNIRFLSTEMEKALCNIWNISNNRRELSRRLSRYYLEEYSFDRLLRGVVNQVDLEENSKDKCKDILNWLWKYYDTEDHQAINDVRVKVICRDGVIRYANECYLGKEFYNELGERLTSIYTNNYVSPACFDVGESDIETITEFLEWIGVSAFPRFIMRTLAGQERKEYLKHCEKLYVQRDNYAYTYSEFTYVEKVVVGCFEHFEDLLIHSTFNDLLAWFVIDDNIGGRINSVSEDKNPDACVTGWPGKKQDKRIVAPAKMKSYIRWVLANLEWIPSKDGIKKRPDHCCFDDDNLSPVIIVPDVDYLYLKEIVGRNCKRDIDAILSKIGVSDVFQEMNKCVVYDVLLALPSIDAEYKKGKSLYRKMIRDGLPPEEYINNNPSYYKFLKEGTVLVKNGDTKQYVPVSTAYYADKKVFSDEILRNFNMFDADSRSGEEKIKKLFGVKPLKYSNVEVDGTPIIHPLDDEFKREYARFIPFVYACRIELKNAKADFRRLKSTKIVLCSQVNIRYSFENRSQVSSLGKFETVYLRKNNTAYIQVPVDIKTFDELHYNFDFADAVAELITAFLDVNEDKDFYRDLFRDSMVVREKKMRIDRNDDNLEVLTKARKQFNTEVNLKDEFWMTIAELMQLDLAVDIDSSGIVQSLGIDKQIEVAINYEELSRFENVPVIINLFSQLDIDIPQFNTMAVHTIDLRAYWENEFNKNRELYRGKYQAYLYALLKDEHNNAEEYYEKCEIYDVADCVTNNTIYENVDELFETIFEVSTSDLDSYDDEVISSIIANNIKKCSQSDMELLDSRCSKSRINSYALFDRLPDLLFSLNESEPDEIGISKDDPVMSVIDDVLASSPVGFSVKSTQAQISEAEPILRSGVTKRRKKSYSESSEITKQNAGLLGEAIVFKELKQIYPSTRWVSGNAEKAGSVAKGDDTCGYDISYIDNNGNTQYVEVKASRDDKIVFYLSDSELRFACNHAEHYEVIFVHIGEDGMPEGKPWRLGHLFAFTEGEDLFNNDRFTIESNNYTITAVGVDKMDDIDD